MKRALLTIAVASFAALSSASAQTFELKPKKIKLNNGNAEVFPELELRVQGSLSGVESEPKYKSKTPQKFTTNFGGDDGVDVTFATDEKKGSGKGFDSLIADLKGTGNLKKGKKLSGKPVRRGTNYEDTVFPAFKLKYDAGEDTEDYSIQARLSVSRTSITDKTPSDSTLYLTSLSCLEGKVELAGEKQKMVVFDANCNGVFGERGSNGRAGSKVSGDKIWVGKASTKIEDSYIASLPLGKYFLFDGKYFEISIGDNCMAEIKEATVPLGKIKVSQPGFLLELREGSDVLYVSNSEGDELDIPTGDYKITTPGFRRKGKGGIWELQGETGSLNMDFDVSEGELTEIEVGPPLKLVCTSTMRREGTGHSISLKFWIEGSQGEKYKYLRKNGQRVKLPSVSIRNEKGKEVKKGSFEYG